MFKWTAILVLILVLPLTVLAQKNSCLDCHRELEGKLRVPVEAFPGDVHEQFGLSCADCHGGNPNQEDIELAKDKSFKGAPTRFKIPEACGTCHSDAALMRRFNPNLRVDQLNLYWTSQHGQFLKKGDPKVAVCTDCHGVHGIQTANFPKSPTFAWNIPETCGRCHSDPKYMEPYRIPANQVQEYKESVHAVALYEKKDLAAPVCNDCHGNHGASPPEVAAVAFVCRQCHPSAGDLFSKSPHKAAFDGLGISECEACHGNHRVLRPSDEMLASGDQDVCLRCHDAGTEPYQQGAQMKERLDAFVAAYENASALLRAAETKGVEMSPARFRLQEASTALIHVRNLTHKLSLSEVEAKLDEGKKVVDDVLTSGEAALEEARFRRTGLIVATIFLVLLAGAIFLKLRDLRQRSE
ncbi:MAG: cytochrome c3 family protein [Candidatus Aminicenantales bacterium]